MSVGCPCIGLISERASGTESMYVVSNDVNDEEEVDDIITNQKDKQGSVRTKDTVREGDEQFAVRVSPTSHCSYSTT
ncbi:hypothetical protein ACOMHN_048896 [Nucella lapillus]